MGEIRGVVEAWLKHRPRSLYDLYARAYLILGLLGYHVVSEGGRMDRWIIGSIIWGIILLLVVATGFEVWIKRRRGDGPADPDVRSRRPIV